jgi:hypothetical protein
MKLKLILFSTLLLLLFINLSFAQQNVLSAEQQDEMIIIRIDKKTFTSYRYGDGQKYPYFYPVNGPSSGLPLTTESSLPYPHHRSLWFGCDRVNGGNYWQEGNDRGQIISRIPQIVENTAVKIHILDKCDWKQPGKKPIIEDERNIIITAPSKEIRIIDFKITLTALTDINIEKSNHSLFSARMHPSLSVQSGGTLINADGKSSEKGTANQSSSWCDYSNERFGIIEGLAIFDSPQNIWFPSKWFTRDYGFFSPTNMNWIEQDFHLDKSKSVTFQYRVIVHTGNSKQANVKNLFSKWTKSDLQK